MTARMFFRFKSLLLIISALCMLLIPASTSAEPVSAIIYPNDAKIVEHFTADVVTEGGLQLTRFFLPIHARKETLTVNTPSGMQITSVTVEEQMMPVAMEMETLKDRLKELNRKKSELENRIKANTAYIEFWQTQSKTQPETIADIASVEKLGISIKKGIAGAYDEIYQHNLSIDDLTDQITEIQKQLNDLTGASKKRWQVQLSLTGQPKPEIGVTCAYHITNCGWRPAYTINALPAESEMALNWYAEIFQNTGMDWKDTDIKIATARVVTRPEPPFLPDWIIQPREAIVYSKFKRSARMAEDSLMAMAPAMEADAGAPPEPEREEGFSFDTYNLGRHTVKAGESRRFTIRDMRFNADYQYLIRPQITPQACLFARLNHRIDDDSENFIKLPRGEATFLVDSAFISSRLFSMHDPEQKLFFGSDPGVDVTLTTLEKKSNETGFLIGKKQYQWGWKVTVNNLKSYTIDILAEDAYPQIRDERIKLKETVDKIKPEKKDHLLEWTFQVSPNKEAEFEYGYSITYPDDMDLYFGGR